MRRLAPALAAAALLAAAAQASAQAPDERADARAFADAALRHRAAVAEAFRMEEARRTPAGRPCRPDRVPRRHRRDATKLMATAGYGALGRLLGPALLEFSLALHAVDTADPVLRSGRTAWRRMRRLLARMAARPAVDLCAELRRWARAGYEPIAAVRDARRAWRVLRAFDGNGFERRVHRAAARLRRLGVPRDESYAFTGGTAEVEEPARAAS
jgi:hypothetical protein